MKFDLSKIELSKPDIKRSVKLPKKLTKELAEFLGIMTGDGHLGIYINTNAKGSKLINSDLRISGNKKEKPYLKYVMGLFHSLFNINLYYTQDTAPNAIILRIHSKCIVQFLNRICGIPLYNKTLNSRIPIIIKNSNVKIKCHFLRGLADTDFSLIFQNKIGKGHNYPLIKGSFVSKCLVNDLEETFSQLGFKCSTYYNEIRKDKRFEPKPIHNIYLYGRNNLKRWISLIGFSNPKFQRKIKKWSLDGICPPGY